MKKLIIWLDEDGEVHISEPAAFEGKANEILAVLPFEEGEEPMLFSDLECEDEIGIER
jgi:hypothetical protein